MKKSNDVVQLPREIRKRIDQFVSKSSVEPPANNQCSQEMSGTKNAKLPTRLKNATN